MTMYDKDINKAIDILNKSKAYSFSQAAVSRNNKIIAIEGKEGTQKMLKKIKNKKGGVLVKFPKKKQDIRVDLPTIGIDTLKQCKIAGLSGVVLKHKRNIFLDKTKCVRYANKNNDFKSSKMKKIILIFLIYFLQFLNLSSNEHKLEEIIKGLNNPWSLSFMTEEDVLITEKSGSLLKINLTNKKINKFTHNLNILEDGQGGLLEVLLSR